MYHPIHFSKACQHSVSFSLNTSHRCLHSAEKFENFHQDIQKLSLEVCGLKVLLLKGIMAKKAVDEGTEGLRGFTDNGKYHTHPNYFVL